MTMKTVVLVGCGKSKLDHSAPAQDLYTGPLFRKARAWAEKHGDEWGILSAKHFLVMPDQVLKPYEKKLSDLSEDHLCRWVVTTNRQIRYRWKLWEGQIRVICLAGKDYAQAFDSDWLWPKAKIKAEYPLSGMGIGKRIQFLGAEVKEIS